MQSATAAALPSRNTVMIDRSVSTGAGRQRQSSRYRTLSIGTSATVTTTAAWTVAWRAQRPGSWWTITATWQVALGYWRLISALGCFWSTGSLQTCYPRTLQMTVTGCSDAHLVCKQHSMSASGSIASSRRAATASAGPNLFCP